MYAPSHHHHNHQNHRRGYQEPDWSAYDDPPSPPPVAAFPTRRLASRPFSSPPPASHDDYDYPRPDTGRHVPNAPPVSRLQLMQARFQKRLLQEKEEKMLQLYQDNNSNRNAPPQRGPVPGQGGAVRQFFAQRRAALQNGGPPVPPPVNLNSSLNAGQSLAKPSNSLNGSWTTGTFVRNAGPKQGSPVGWDKSYPLSPLDRDSSGGSSSGYDSGNSFGSTVGHSPYLGTTHQPPANNFGGTRNLSKSHNGNGYNNNGYGYQRPPAAAAPAPLPHKATVPAARTVRPSRRTPSLDRRAPAGNGTAALGSTLAGMRRSNSQIITSGNQRDAEAENFPPRQRSRPVQPVKSSEPIKTTPPLKRSPPPNNLPLVSSKPPAGPPPLSYDSPSPPQQNSRGKKPLVPAISSSPKPPSGQQTPVKAAKSQKKPASRTPSSADPNLSECHICSRRFAHDRIEKHMEICQKAAIKKRKVFDPTKMRMKGTELEEFVRKSGKSQKRANEQKEPKKADWRQKRENFIEAMREAKAAQRHLAAGGKLSDLPAPKPMDTSDYIQCPHCNRKFSEGAAERHIPKCKNIKSNKKN